MLRGVEAPRPAEAGRYRRDQHYVARSLARQAEAVMPPEAPERLGAFVSVVDRGMMGKGESVEPQAPYRLTHELTSDGLEGALALSRGVVRVRLPEGVRTERRDLGGHP